MIGGHLLLLSDEAVAVGGQVVLDVTFSAGSELDFGGIGVGRSEIGDAERVTGILRFILSGRRGTAWRGLSEPIPA